MLIDNFINVGMVHIGVPDGVRVHHNDGTFTAAI
jgi:hypothetical protein